MSAAFPSAEGPLTTYVRALRGRAWLVALVALATVAVSIAWLAVRSPTYKATAEVVVTPLPQDDPALVGIQPLPDPFETTRTLQTAAGLLHSMPAASATARIVGRGSSARGVLADVDVEPRGESNLIAIVASADSPSRAALLANTFTTSALRQRGASFQASLTRRIAALTRQLEGLVREARRSSDPATLTDTRADVTQRRNRLEELRGIGDPTLRQTARAQPPTAASGAPQWLIVVLAAIFGAALGAGAALLRSAVDQRIGEERELLEIYPLPVLARTADSGAARALPRNREAFRTLAARVAAPLTTAAANGPARVAWPERAPLLLVSSASPGDGKTTCAVELARALAGAGNDTILIDLDLRSPGCAPALGMDVGEERTLLHTESLATALIDVRDVPGLRLIVGGAAADEAELVTLSRRAAAIVHAARVHPAFVVVDTAPLGQVGDALHVAPHADEILLVARLGNTERGALARVRERLEQSAIAATGFVLVAPSGASQPRRYVYALSSERASRAA